MTGSRRASYTFADRERAIGKLADFVSAPGWEEVHREGSKRFWGAKPAHVSDDQYRTTLHGQLEHRLKYMFWFMFDCQLGSGGRPVDLLLHQGGLSAGERAYLERARAAHLRLYEVRRIGPGSELELEDLWTGDVVPVRAQDPSALRRWDVLGARVIEGPDGTPVIEPGLYRYPPEHKEQLVAWLRLAYDEFKKDTGQDDVAEMYRGALIGLNQFWVNLVVFPVRQELTTPDGEPIVFAKAVFDVEEAARVREVLAAHREFVEEEDGCFTWVVTTEGGEWGCANVTLTEGRLELEAVSERWAERGRRALEEAAGELIRYRATRVETQEQLMRAPQETLADVVRTGVEQLFGEDIQGLATRQDELVRAWLDRPNKELGNRTPREAAKDPSLRAGLVSLLKCLENDADLQRRTGLPAYDPSWLWEEFGLEP